MTRSVAKAVAQQIGAQRCSLDTQDIGPLEDLPEAIIQGVRCAGLRPMTPHAQNP